MPETAWLCHCSPLNRNESTVWTERTRLGQTPQGHMAGIKEMAKGRKKEEEEMKTKKGVIPQAKGDVGSSSPADICQKLSQVTHLSCPEWRHHISLAKRRGWRFPRDGDTERKENESMAGTGAERERTTAALRKRQEAELEVAEMKMLRFSSGVTKMDRIRNEYIRGTAHNRQHISCFPQFHIPAHTGKMKAKNRDQSLSDSRELDGSYDQLTDSVEDDFELSTVCHRPESMDKLQEQTKFTKKELQVLYRGFKNECPSGVVNEENFKTIYSQFFPQGDSSMYAHFLFEAFDTNKNGSVSFEDFVFGLSIILRGTINDRLNWAFNLYDLNKDGCITKEEMLDIMRSIYDMMGKYTYPTMQDDAPREHVESFFQKMDRNKDGVVTIEEFIESCKKDENIMQSMQLFDNVI
ncbi:hypothetical protein ABVT39_021860 [Epinephelus coioides]